MPKIRITKQDEGVKVPEIKRNIWKALNPYSLKTGKTVYFKKTLSFSLSPIPLSIFNADGSRLHIAKSRLEEILLRDLEDHT